MNIKIYPSQVHGTINAPPSKSITHRAIVLAALARGTSVIKNPLLSDDTLHTIDACKAFGVDLKRTKTLLTIRGSDGVLRAPKKPLHLGNSGTTLRIMTAVACLAKGKTTLTGDKRLQERPMSDLLYALRNIGIAIESKHNNGCAPVTVTGGQLKGGKVKISVSTSSQFVTALLLVAPFASEEIEIIVQGLPRSKPYIDVTLELMKKFGLTVTNNDYETFTVKTLQVYKSASFVIEGDYSSASYLLGAAAVTGSAVSVGNLNPKSAQGDRFFLEILARMGLVIKKNASTITVTGPKQLRSISLDMGNHPDVVQTLAILAAYAKGTTHISNIEHLIHKETNRIEHTAAELRKMGIRVTQTQSSLTIEGGKPKGTAIDTHHDHRMAMSFAVAGLSALGPTIIEKAEVVGKSYPTFFEDLKKIGVKMEKSQ